MAFAIHPVTELDKPWVLHTVQQWGADFIVTRGRKVYPSAIEGFYAAGETGDHLGLITFEIIGDQCEVVTLDAFTRYSGIGTALLNHVRTVATARGCKRLWLITTNDNVDAMRFYQRRGFVLAAVHVNAIAESRKIKPTIREIGEYGIPLRDEVEFEMWL